MGCSFYSWSPWKQPKCPLAGELTQRSIGVLLGTGKGGALEGHSDSGELQKPSCQEKSLHPKVCMWCDSTRIERISQKSKATETENPSVSRKIDPRAREEELSGNTVSQLWRSCAACVC